MPMPEPSSAAIEAALATVLSSTAFESRPRLRRFLAHVVRHSIAGDEDSLKEYAIGVEVFDRGTRFDPLCDSIVRVEAFKLRNRLRVYYCTEGATDLVTISMPKGRYRATFQLNEGPPAAILDDPERLCSQVEWSILRGTAAEVMRGRRYLQHAIQRWPGRPDLHVSLASTVLAALEMECIAPDEGVPLVQCAANAALQLDPARGDAYFYAGVSGIRSRNKAPVLAGAHQALQFTPKNSSAHFWAGSILAADCRMSDALVYLQQAARLQPYAMFFQTWVAVTLFCTGRAALGLRHLHDILAFEPHDYLANYWLSLLATHAGQYDEARDAAHRAYQVSGSAQALAALGFVEGRAGCVEAAEAILQTLTETARTQYVARSGLSAIHIALGRLEGAAREWRVAQAEGDWELSWAGPDPRWAPLRGKVAGF